MGHGNRRAEIRKPSFLFCFKISALETPPTSILQQAPLRKKISRMHVRLTSSHMHTHDDVQTAGYLDIIAVALHRPHHRGREPSVAL